MRPSDNANAPHVEAQTRRLLTRYAEGMPSDVSVEVRVRSALTTQRAHRWRASRIPSWGEMGGWARAGFSVALTLVLLAGFFTVLRLRANTPTSCPTVQANAQLTPCPGQHFGVTIVVEQTYADPTRTALLLHFNLTGADLNLGQSEAPIQPDTVTFGQGATLTDSRGNIYDANNFTEPINYHDRSFPGGYAEFDPLPQTMLTSPQILTLHLRQITFDYTTPAGEAFLPLEGSWTVTFRVTPQPTHSINLHVAPQTHGGITVQPLRLDIGSRVTPPFEVTPFDRLSSGERLILRISGLPPETPRSVIADLAYKFTLPGGGGADGAPIGAVLQFEGQKPAMIAGMAVDPQFSYDPVAGPTGTFDLEVIFLSPPLSSITGVKTLTITGLMVGPATARHLVHGPWQFEVPLG